VSCGSNEPKPIKLNSDTCEFCKMTISNGKFGAELTTTKGRYYKFDDVTCMIRYATESTSLSVASFYVNDYLKENTLIPVENSFYLKGGTINSPMRGNLAAFSSENELNKFQKKLNAEAVTWEQVYNAHK
jgi:copper chaperone NosL